MPSGRYVKPAKPVYPKASLRQNLLHLCQIFLNGKIIRNPLHQIFIDCVNLPHRRIKPRIGSRLVGSDGDQILILIVDTQQIPHLSRQPLMLLRNNIHHQTGDAGSDVDGRKMVLIGKLPGAERKV